ncbi:hypothetical protein O1611_g1551 [Lasiodiplodia mahajangana]|uniref:Uncharacterized protein n=1 Tax=Lasiodiplodia mahajangana TaxID=1108764 RepID=A0ACC2JXN1_9PEZI|nr:hypothetical protein O1611_g1551 [Lasiodiplodia mahajangana]
MMTSPFSWLICGNDDEDDCDAELPKQPGEEPKCKSGSYKGCMCNTPSDIFIEVAGDEEQQSILLISDLLGEQIAQPEPEPPTECDRDNLSDIPANVFGGPQNNVYHHFCDNWAAGTELRMTVDASGNNKSPEWQLLRRTPPPNPDLYTHYNIDLGFTPSDGDEKCVKECVDAFSQISNACRNTGAQNQEMQRSGSVDVGCGVFDYTITPTTPLELQERQCYASDEFGSHHDIHGDQVTWISGFACTGAGIKTIKRGDSSTNIAYAAYDNRQPVQFNIYWKDGCVLDYPSYDEVHPANPLVLDDPGHTYCQDLFINNYKKCYNDGVGGSIQAGCLVYEFKATHD